MILKVFFSHDDSMGGGTQPRPWVMTQLLGLQRKEKRQGGIHWECVILEQLGAGSCSSLLLIRLLAKNETAGRGFCWH